MGVGFVEREADLPAAVMAALSFSGAAIVEREDRRASRCACGLHRADRSRRLPLVEIMPKSGVYDYAARYTAGATEYHAPARLDHEERGRGHERCSSKPLQRSASRDVTPCRHHRRRRRAARGSLDVNVSPGMTDTILLPMAAQAAGIALRDLCDRVIQRG